MWEVEPARPVLGGGDQPLTQFMCSTEYLDTCEWNAALAANDAATAAALKVSGPTFPLLPHVFGSLSLRSLHRCFLPKLAHSPTERNHARARALVGTWACGTGW